MAILTCRRYTLVVHVTFPPSRLNLLCETFLPSAQHQLCLARVQLNHLFIPNRLLNGLEKQEEFLP